MTEPATLVEPGRVASRLRRAFGAGRLQVRAVSRHAVRVSLTRSAWLTGASGAGTLLEEAQEALRGWGYRVRRSDDGIYQAGNFVPTLVVGYLDWEDQE